MRTIEAVVASIYETEGPHCGPYLLIKEIPVPSETGQVKSIGSLPKMFGSD